LSLAELDAEIGAYIIGTYNARVHSEIGAPPTGSGSVMDGYRECQTAWKRWTCCWSWWQNTV
jgi:hypothetical protein